MDLVSDDGNGDVPGKDSHIELHQCVPEYAEEEEEHSHVVVVVESAVAVAENGDFLEKIGRSVGGGGGGKGTVEKIVFDLLGF